jgi:hypothetical protein
MKGIPMATMISYTMYVVLALGAAHAFADDYDASLSLAQSQIVNFYLDPAHPEVVRGARPGAKKTGISFEVDEVKLKSDLILLQKIHIKSIVDLQGGDVRSDAQVPELPALAVVALNNAIDLANTYLEPGEDTQSIGLEKNAVKDLGLNFASFQLISIAPIEGAWADTVRSTLKFMHDRNNQPVYVHCAHGHDRTGMIVALYQVCYLHAKPDDAYREMLTRGHNDNDHVTQSTDIFFWRSVSTDQFCADVGGQLTH